MKLRKAAISTLGLASVATSTLAETSDLVSLSLSELLGVQVSSRRFEEPYRSAPRSLSVFTSEELELQAIDSVYELALYVPNLSFHRSFGDALVRPVIRGVSTITGEPAAGVLVDGIRASNIATRLMFDDIEQIEILRGPEAALYGRSAFSGALNFITKKPNFENRVFSKIQTSSASEKKLHSSANWAPTHSLGLMLNGTYKEHGHRYANTLGLGGGGYDDQRTRYVQLATIWQAPPKHTVYLRSIHQNDEQGLWPTYLQNSQFNNCYLNSGPQYFCGELTSPSRIGFTNIDTMPSLGSSIENTRHHFAWTHTTKNHETRLILDTNTHRNKERGDGDFYELESYFYTATRELKERSIDLTRNMEFAHSRILFGLTHYRSEKRSLTQNIFYRNNELTQGSSSDTLDNVDNQAAFFSMDYYLPARAYINLDMRYSKDTIKYRAGDPDQANHGSQTWHSLSPRLNFSQTLSSDTLYYASISLGTKPGGFNPSIESINYANEQERTRILENINYDEERLISYELGLKSSFYDERAFIALSAFYIRWLDLQLTQNLSYENDEATTRRASVTQNGGRSRNYGAELDLDVAISEHFSTKMNLGYAPTELQDTYTSAQFDLTGDGRVDGHHIPNAPELTAMAALRYMHTFTANTTLTANLSAHYESKRYIAEHNLTYIGAQQKINANLKLDRGPWCASLWGKNLNNDTHPESAARFGDAATFFARRGFAIDLPIERQIGLSLSYQY